MNNENWKAIIQGDVALYSRFYQDYFKKFYNYGKKFTPNSCLVEDAIQEVFADIWANREKLLQTESLGGYFFSSFRYTLFRHIKKEHRITGYHSPETEPEFSADSILIRSEQDAEKQARLMNCLQVLTPHQREAIFLRYYQNLSYEDVAGILNITVKATYKIIARSLAAMKANIAVLLVLHLLEKQMSVAEKIF